MKDRKPSEALPSTDESVYDTKSVSSDRERSCTDVLKPGPCISCWSMSSDFSRGQPPLFSTDPPQDGHEDSRGPLHDLHTLKEVGQMPVLFFKDYCLIEQRDNDPLELLQRKLKSSLKHQYEPFIEGLRPQSTRVCVREDLGVELHHIDPTMTKRQCPESLMDVTELFRASPASVRTVLTIGTAGVGKSVQVQRSIVDWCEDRALQHIQLLCPLPFPQLNLLQAQSWTVMELLQTFCPGLRESSITELCHCRLLFILDGLDECRLPLDFSIKNRCCDPEAPMSVDALVTNLMLGNLLPNAQLWITSRPTAARSIPPTLIHRVTEVRGFSDRQKETYFLQNIQDEELARTVLANVRSSAPLHSLSHLPLFCSITASVCADSSSMTHMFLHFLSYHMKSMRHRYGLHRSRVRAVIQGLSRLAHVQLQRGERLFWEQQVKDCGVGVREALVYSGLCTQVSTEDPCGGHGAFSFVHLSLQEFLAALFVHMSFCGDQDDLHGDLRDHPLFLQFLLGLALDSSASMLTQMDLQGGVRPETCSMNPATGGHKAVSSLCRSQARLNGEGGEHVG